MSDRMNHILTLIDFANKHDACHEAVEALTPYYVNVYIRDTKIHPHTRGYIFTYMPEFSFLQPSQDEAYALCDKLEKQYEQVNAARPDIESIASKGEYYVTVENHPAREH